MVVVVHWVAHVEVVIPELTDNDKVAAVLHNNMSLVGIPTE